MRIVGSYSFSNGESRIQAEAPTLLEDIRDVIAQVGAGTALTKVSKEKTMNGRLLYSPRKLNATFAHEFGLRGWKKVRVRCDYSADFYAADYRPTSGAELAYREMDFVKARVGVEVQLGKYAFMVYNVCAKMTIFRNLKYIDFGVEIVPVRELAQKMSSGVSYFEQIVWDLEKRGVANIDVPVIILGIAP